MVSNITEFERGLAEEVRDTEALVGEATRKLSTDIISDEVLQSPVGNPDKWQPQSLPPPPGYVGGRFRANWQMSTDRPKTGVLDRTDKPSDGEFQVAVGRNFLKIWIVNNLPYAVRLAEGHSGQAANGWVDRVIERHTNALDGLRL